MAIAKDLARVLRVYEQGNTSLVLVLLGQSLGQVRVLAKGARRWTRKGFAGGFDLLAEGELVAYPRDHGELWILKEWDERHRFAPPGRPGGLRAASFLCEFTEALTRETSGSSWSHDDRSPGQAQGHEDLYKLLDQAVAALTSDQPPGWLLLRYVLAALSCGGWLPDLDACSACHTRLPAGAMPVRLSFSGILCQDCAAGDAPLYENARRPGPASPRCVWLTPEVLHALAFVLRTGQSVQLSTAGARTLARAMMLLVHAALEHDLRTLNGAAAAVMRLSAPRRTRSRTAPVRPGGQTLS